MNPTQHQTVIRFLPLALDEEPKESEVEEETHVEIVDEQPPSIGDVRTISFKFFLVLIVKKL